MDSVDPKGASNRERCLSFNQSRPPRRKRRPSLGIDSNDVTRLTSTAESLEDVRPPVAYRSGSVPPTPLPHSPPSHILSSSPAPLPRIRRHFRHKSPASVSPSSVPTIIRGSSAIDLSDIAPFGTLQDSFQQSVKGFASNIRRRNSFKSSFTSGKWPWMWHKSNNSSAASASKDQASIPEPAPLKHSGSFLSGRKRKSRHISCPDISSASSESSRSTSPSSSSLKMSLTSLFHRSSPSSSLAAARPIATSAPVTIQRRGKTSTPTNVGSAEEGVVGDFMSAILTDEACDHYLEEFAGLEFYPEIPDHG